MPTARMILEAATVAGAEFSAAAVAAGVETAVEAVEEHCTDWPGVNNSYERRERASGRMGRWRHGTAFSMPSIKKCCTSGCLQGDGSNCINGLANGKSRAMAREAREIAAELAVHFEQGRDYRRAVQYLQHAGENATRRLANTEAISLLTKGLELLKTLPDTPSAPDKNSPYKSLLAPRWMLPRAVRLRR